MQQAVLANAISPSSALAQAYLVAESLERCRNPAMKRVLAAEWARLMRAHLMTRQERR